MTEAALREPFEWDKLEATKQGISVEEYLRRERSGAEEADRRYKERVKRIAEAEETRTAAGLGFWRLVWIVALGILIAEGIAGAIVFCARALLAHGLQ